LIIDQTDKPGFAEMKKHSYRIIPMLINYNKDIDDFDGNILHTLLKDSVLQNNIIYQLLQKIQQNKLQGINIDLEEVWMYLSRDLENTLKRQKQFRWKPFTRLVFVSTLFINYNLLTLEKYADPLKIPDQDQLG
jgi:spore germination protein YaaH